MATATEKVSENGRANGAREVVTICGFCGVGCGLTLKVEDGVIQKVTVTYMRRFACNSDASG